MAKIIKMPSSDQEKLPETFEDAHLLEGNNDWKHVAAMYERLLKKSPNNIKIINRLIIAYRKLKDRKREIGAIDKAIAYHEGQYTPLNRPRNRVSLISKQLNKLLGHTDKKGRNAIVSIEIIKLEKRKAIVQKLL